MSGEYALQLLKYELRDKKHEVEQYGQRQDNIMGKTITKLKHQIYDLEFAIELLEEYQD
ncbi:hypothetical protein [Paenibacillus sp. ISL-20]|uniref:hypothetical protein n=1 Tax=Paenibacillus sp. ISL-20 TaxID=2819163 RepID=UPI001BE8CB18|nr:hypothetical protein [Paenibacillus sp. ISL-20]MBT2759927.1 hypothetical protein [Paenibacillus sp. ISL-20]